MGVGRNVLIVGAGTVGLLAAYYLQRLGASVTVVERRSIAYKSPRCPVTDCFSKADDGSHLSGVGGQLLGELLDDLNYTFHHGGHFCFSSHSTAASWNIIRAKSFETLTMNQMLADLGSVVQERGGVIIEHLEVQKLVIRGRQVQGVQTRYGELLADEVVLCTGAQSKRFQDELGVDLPLVEERVHIGDDQVDVPITSIGRPYVGRPEGLGGVIIAIGHDVDAKAALAVGKTIAMMVEQPDATYSPLNEYAPSTAKRIEEFPWGGV